MVNDKVCVPINDDGNCLITQNARRLVAAPNWPVGWLIYARIRVNVFEWEWYMGNSQAANLTHEAIDSTPYYSAYIESYAALKCTVESPSHAYWGTIAGQGWWCDEGEPGGDQHHAEYVCPRPICRRWHVQHYIYGGGPVNSADITHLCPRNMPLHVCIWWRTHNHVFTFGTLELYQMLLSNVCHHQASLKANQKTSINYF